MPDAVAEKALVALAARGITANGEDIRERHIGAFGTRADVTRELFRIDAPHIDIDAWPYIHIDWTAAAAGLTGSDVLLEVDGHWFDAAPA